VSRVHGNVGIGALPAKIEAAITADLVGQAVDPDRPERCSPHDRRLASRGGCASSVERDAIPATAPVPSGWRIGPSNEIEAKLSPLL